MPYSRKKLVKMTLFCVFQRIFKMFFKIGKIRNLKLIVSQLFGVSQSSHKSYLLVKSHFWCFLYSAILEGPKTPKIRFYEQVWYVWWLRRSKKLTYNNFEVSDFFNFEKILKIRWKTKKRVIFTDFFLDYGIYLVNSFYTTSS